MNELLDDFRPQEGEAAVLSLLAARTDADWRVVCGSLLTVPQGVATSSWRRWKELQPRGDGAIHDSGGFDLGPLFSVEPFSGLRIVRTPLDTDSWVAAVDDLPEGAVGAGLARYSFAARSWSAPGLLTGNGVSPGSDVLLGARRPVVGTVAELEQSEIPASDGLWQLQLPPHLPPGPDLGRISPHRTLANWPRELLGITWPGGVDVRPSPVFVVGRIQSEAWIARVRPDTDQDDLIISIGWDAQAIDPIGCSLLVESEHGGVSLLSRQVKVSDLPAQSAPKGPAEDARNHPWHRRTLDIRLPRGPRRTDWGVSLLSADGRLLDRQPVVARVERIELALHGGGSQTPASRSTIGDRRPVPSELERRDAVRAATDLHAQALQAAAARRVSTVAELKDYLRWRFSARAGELLILDPYLLTSKQAEVIAFLRDLARPVRALAGAVPSAARAEVVKAPDLEVRRLPGNKSLHDRVWLVGETGLLVGTSVNGLLNMPGRGRATTVTDLPFADAVSWREQFEDWWRKART